MSTSETEELLRSEFNRWALEGRGEAMQAVHAHAAQQAISHLALQGGERVLDLGCGVGWATRILAQAVAGEQGIAAGLDLSQEMIARARAASSEVDNVLFAIGSAEEIPWRDEYFHKALCVESLYFFPDPPAVLRELRRVLVSGGRLAITVSVYRENHSAQGLAERLSVPVQVCSTAEYEQMLCIEGFADVKSRQIQDSSPAPQCYTEAWSGGFADEEQFRECHRAGALLLTARKP